MVNSSAGARQAAGGRRRAVDLLQQVVKALHDVAGIHLQQLRQSAVRVAGGGRSSLLLPSHCEAQAGCLWRHS